MSSSSIRLDARAARSRDALRAALARLLASRPFDTLTVREIAAAAGIGYATFFRHYPDREALLADLAADEIAALLDRTVPIFDTADTAASCRALVAWVGKRRSVWQTLLTGGAAAQVREEFMRQAHRLVPGREAPGGTIPVELAVSVATSAVIEILVWWLRDTGNRASEAEVAAHLERLAITPVTARG